MGSYSKFMRASGPRARINLSKLKRLNPETLKAVCRGTDYGVEKMEQLTSGREVISRFDEETRKAFDAMCWAAKNVCNAFLPKDLREIIALFMGADAFLDLDTYGKDSLVGCCIYSYW